MTLRIQDQNAIRSMYERIAPIQTYITTQTNLETRLVELVKIRVSQINGCAYCMTVHAQEGLKAGDRLDRYTVLSAWRETPDWFTPREQTALAWAEALTNISTSQISTDLYAQVRGEFTEKDLADLTLVIITINGTNRMATPFRAPLSHFEVPEAVAN